MGKIQKCCQFELTVNVDIGPKARLASGDVAALQVAIRSFATAHQTEMLPAGGAVFSSALLAFN